MKPTKILQSILMKKVPSQITQRRFPIKRVFLTGRTDGSSKGIPIFSQRDCVRAQERRKKSNQTSYHRRYYYYCMCISKKSPGSHPKKSWRLSHWRTSDANFSLDDEKAQCGRNQESTGWPCVVKGGLLRMEIGFETWFPSWRCEECRKRNRWAVSARNVKNFQQQK